MQQNQQFIGFKFLQCFMNLVVTFLQIYEFVKLKQDGEYDCLYGIIIIWSSSLFLSCIVFCIFRPSQIKKSAFLCYVLSHSEWMSLAVPMIELAKYSIIQMGVITFPINLCNMYLISDTSRDIDTSYYTAIIFINQMFMGITFLNMIGCSQRNKTEAYMIKSIPQISMHFCYWYLIMQCFLYNWIIPFIFLSSNLVFLLIQIAVSLKYDKIRFDSNEIFLICVRHLYQFNCTVYSSFCQSSKDFYLNTWQQLRFTPVQCLNVILLSIIKLIYFPFQIRADIGLYILLIISLYYIYLVVINIYYKSQQKINSVFYTSKWDNKCLSLKKEVLLPLLDDFIYDYNLHIHFDWNTFHFQNKQKLQLDAKLLEKLIYQGIQISFKNAYIVIVDTLNNLKFQLFFFDNSIKKPMQVLEFSKNQEEMKNNIKLINELNMLVNHEIHLLIRINKLFILDIAKLLISLQMFQILQYSIVDYEEPTEIIKTFERITEDEFKNITDQIRQVCFQILGFKKHCSKYLNLNPGLVLYDLYGENGMEQILDGA